MKVLIVTETLYEGGTELFVLRLARALQNEGVFVQVVSLNKRFENKEMTSGFDDVNIKRLSLSFYRIWELLDRVLLKLKIDFSFRYYFQAKQLKRIAGNFDIVHTHYIQVDHLVSKIKKYFLFRHIVTVHGDYSAQYDQHQKGALRFWLRLDQKMKELSERVDHWVVVSDEQLSFLKEKMKIPAAAVSKIYNGYPVVQQDLSVAKAADNIFTIGMVGRGVEQKGWQLLIDAFLKLPDNCRLLLVGGGAYLESLKHMYRANERIVFAGFQSDPVSWMRQMDVFALPTLFPFESLPTVIIEALSCGLPVVATDVGEIENMIKDESTGEEAGYVIEFDGKNLNSDRLYEKLKFMYDNPNKVHKFRQVALGAFKKFEMEKCVSAYIILYNKILSD
ncbi:MAG TPA: glycosyltransferase family 4 protein [Chitinophagaceae bacterium]|nr:glycosyltransferase family 4 protein [Chitinophagaceae bacterium]